MSDVIWWMLDHPSRQKMEDFAKVKEYVTPRFNAEVYAKARGANFCCLEEAYSDWRSYGRKMGLAFDTNKDTLLKVIVKVKDENYLILKWVDYYSSLIGDHNIIIVDCGSKNENFVRILNDLSKRVIVVDYDQYYINIHLYSKNRDFFNVIASNCKYLAVLDADEFIFGIKDGYISPSFVTQILATSDRPAIPGTWFNAMPQQIDNFESEELRGVVTVDVSTSALAGWCSVAGKVLVSSSEVEAAENIGHNMHALGVIRLLGKLDFLQIGILHLTCLPEGIARNRVLNHLRARKIVSSGPISRMQLIDFLAQKLVDNKTDSRAKEYIRRYFDPHAFIGTPEQVWNTFILRDYEAETQDVRSLKSDKFFNLVEQALAENLEKLSVRK